MKIRKCKGIDDVISHFEDYEMLVFQPENEEDKNKIQKIISIIQKVLLEDK